MEKFMKLKALVVLLFFYGSACLLNANAQPSSDAPSTVEENILKKIEKTYNVKQGGNLTVVSEFGAIDVQTAEQDKVETVIAFSPANWNNGNIVIHRNNGNVVIQGNSVQGDSTIVVNGNVVTINGVKVKSDGTVKNGSDAKLDPKVQKAIEDFEVTFEHKGSDVRINGKFKQGRKYWWKELNRLKILFQVTVPQQYNVNLETSDGSVFVADLGGEARAQTSDGSLHFGNIEGNVWGRTSDGSIKLTSCSSPVDLKTSDGSIRIGDVVGDVKAQSSDGSLRFGKIRGSLWAETSDGSIRLEHGFGTVNAKTSDGSIRAQITAQPEQDCSLHTSDGSITVTLISNIALDIDAKTSDGRVSTDFSMASGFQGKTPKNRLKGKINGGGPLLKLRTSDGKIHLRKAAN